MSESDTLTIEPDGKIAFDGDVPRQVRPGRWVLRSCTNRLMVFDRELPGKSRPPKTGGKLALWGDLEATGGISDLMGLIHQSQWSGALTTCDGPAIRTIWFKSGNVRTAGSNLFEDRLGELLYRYGVISEQQLEQALAQASGTQRIGQVLVDLGFVTTHDIFTYLRKQVEDVFFAMVRLRSGSFTFERSSGDEDLPDLSLSTQSLLLDGIRRMDEMQFFRERIPSSQVVASRVDSAPQHPPEEEHAARILELVDGRRTLEELARLSKLGEFDTTKALFQLAQRGFIAIQKEWGASRTKLAPASESGAHRLIHVVNDLLAKIHATLAASNKAERFRADLGAFFRGATAYEKLFAGVKADADGRLPSEVILENLTACKTDKPSEYLHQALNELIFFLVFTVGEVVGRQEEQELTRRLGEILSELRAQGMS